MGHVKGHGVSDIRCDGNTDAMQRGPAGSMDMAASNMTDLRVFAQYLELFLTVLQVLDIHMLDAGLKRRMVLKQERRFLRLRCQRLLKPVQTLMA